MGDTAARAIAAHRRRRSSIYERDRVSAGSVLGSAIAFRLFLFFVPTVVFAVGLMGAISGYVEPRDRHRHGQPHRRAGRIRCEPR